MSTPGDWATRLVRLADQLEPLLTPVPGADDLRDLCDTVRLVFGAAAASVAVVRDDDRGSGLVYLAAAGEGADQIVGARLAAGQGIAGFVAASGQSLVIDRVESDPRFAREVAESTGYVPTSMLVVPVRAGDDVIGVLSVLDRQRDDGATSVDGLEIAAALARQAAPLVTRMERTARQAPAVVQALAVAATADGDHELADALRTAQDEALEADDVLVSFASLLAQLDRRTPEVRAAALRVLRELLDVTAPPRRGR